MWRVRRFSCRLRSFFQSTRAERELDREVASHLTFLEDEYHRRGMTPDDARLAARRALGGIDRAKELHRDERSFPWLEDARRDVPYAVRTLARSPGFTSVATLTIALGIGANTAIFQLADAVRLRPLPVERPGELVEVRMADLTRGRTGTFAGRRPLFTHALWEECRDRQEAFSGAVAWGAYPVNASNRGEARYLQGLWVNGDFFNVLGVGPHIGRVFSSSDDRPGCGSPGAVLGHAFWQREYGGDPSVVGRTITLDGHPFEIIGVASRGFVGLEVGRSFDVATPICAERILNAERSALDDRSWWWLTVIGRLRPGWSVDHASSHLAAVSPGIFQATVAPGVPARVARDYLASTLRAFPAPTGVSGTVREEYETPLWVLLAVAGVVLIIASANVATLLLARATTRAQEVRVRLALGASRGRLIRQFLTESALVGSIGAVAGLFLAQTLSAELVSLLQTSGFQFFAVSFDLDPNWRVLLFGTATAVVTCLLFGLAPAIVATRPSAGGLAHVTARTVTDPGGRSVARASLVVLQVALSLMLVVVAMLFARTLHNLTAVDTGFDTDHVVWAVLDHQRARVPADQRLALHERLLGGIRAAPGVESAAQVLMVPLTGESWQGRVVVDGVEQQKQSYFNRISPAFFQTMRTTLVAGRDFADNDRTSGRPVAIVNESFARELLGRRDPIGSSFQMVTPSAGVQPRFEIVGLVKDTKYTDVREPFQPTAFLPASQSSRPFEYVNLVIRTSMPQPAVSAAVLQAANRLGPGALAYVHPLRAQIRDSLVRERLTATLSGLFGVLAALLAMLGLYGVMAYRVVQRTGEIGIRMALGAQRAEVMGLVLRQSAALTAAGIALGVAGAAGATRYLEGMLFGLMPLDAPTFIGVPLMFAVVAALASYLPARRATKVDPLTALRWE